MAGRLVTVATFDRVTDAQFAKGALEEAGIQAAITNEDVSTVLGAFVTMASGIKVLVREEDEERAVKVLDEAFAEKPLSAEELAAQAEAEAPEDASEAAEQPSPPVSDPVADSAAREKDARTALLTGCLGWFIPFAHLFAIVMMMSASSGPGRLSRRGKLHVLAAAVVVFLPWLSLLLIYLLFFVGREP
jgi:hypothetical protein